MHFLSYLFNNPLFGTCFILSTIPVWVPIFGLMFGFDPVLMLLLLVLTVLSSAYVDSEVTFTNPLGKMYEYIFAKPLFRLLKTVFTLSILLVLVVYAQTGTSVDKWISAIMIVFVVKTLYFSFDKSGYWNIKGLERYQIITMLSGVLVFFLWLSFFTLNISPYEKLAIALTAMFVSALTFLKKNEGLI